MGFFEEAIHISNTSKSKLREANEWEISDLMEKDLLQVDPALKDLDPKVEYRTKGHTWGLKTYQFRADTLYRFANKGTRTQLAKALKKIGAQDIESSAYGIFFNADTAPYEERIRAERQQELERRKQAVSHIDIEQWRPSPAILQKIKDYQAKGSRVNVKAIKDPDKLFTYYYAAKMIGFGPLLGAITDIVDWKDRDILEAIDLNVRTEKRNVGNEGFISWFQPLIKYCVDHNIEWKATDRTPTQREMEPDTRNGRIWTLAYTFTAKGRTFNLAVHTDEGGGSPRGYCLDERDFSSLREVCNAVIVRLDSVREDWSKTARHSAIRMKKF